MGRFVVRRLFSMIVVLFAISILTFLIFQAIPNGDPALRLAGRLATPADGRRRSASTWGFDKPIYVQYVKTMKQDLHGPGGLLHAAGQRARRDQARPAGDALAGDRRRRSSGCSSASLFGVLSAITRRAASPTAR